MTDNKDELLHALNVESELSLNMASSLHYEAQELDRSVKRIQSLQEIKETTESLAVLAASIRTTELNLKALRQRYSI